VKNILIPTDFSENAQDALSYALAFEHGEEVMFHIFHAVQPVMISADGVMVENITMTQDLVKNVNLNLDALKLFSKNYFEENNLSNFKIDTDALVGDTVKLIKQKAEDVNAEMIIMGTNGAGHSNFERLFGTVTTSLLNHATCPIILIPLGYKYKEIDNIIFSTNLMVDDSYSLWKAFNLIEPHTPLVRFLHVKQSDVSNHEKKLEEFKNYILDTSPAISTHFHVETGDDPEDIFENYAMKYEAEMIIMAKKRKNIYQRLVNPNLTRKVLNKLKFVPLMIIN